MKRGRPFEPGNKLGRGRPKGSRNKRTLSIHGLLDEHAEAIIRQSIVTAFKGDVSMQRALLGYVVARPKEVPYDVGPLPMATIEDLTSTFLATLHNVSSGRITPKQCGDIVKLIDARRRSIETEDLAKRLNSLEEALTVSEDSDPTLKPRA